MSETNVQTIAETKVRPETQIPTMCIHSIDIAEALVVDYPHFRDLLNIPKDKTDPTGKKHVYIFRKTEELFQNFLSIVEERKKERLKMQQLIESGNVENN